MITQHKHRHITMSPVRSVQWGLSAVLVVGSVLAIAAAAGVFRSSPGPRQNVNTALSSSAVAENAGTRPPLPVNLIDRAQAQQQYGAAGMLRADRVQVKHMTWGEYWRGGGNVAVAPTPPGLPAPDPTALPADDTDVLVVASGGDYAPPVVGTPYPKPYRWRVVVIDSLHNIRLSVLAAPDGQVWPAFFDRLSDRP
jgi:hypothetical protein